MAGGLLGKGTSKGPIDVAAFLDSKVTDGVSELISMGLLVSLGTTRDGGAFAITITLDGEYEREYFRDSAEAGEWLSGAVAAVRPLLAERIVEPVTPKRRTRAR